MVLQYSTTSILIIEDYYEIILLICYNNNKKNSVSLFLCIKILIKFSAEKGRRVCSRYISVLQVPLKFQNFIVRL